jgi:hypothetical protein
MFISIASCTIAGQINSSSGKNEPKGIHAAAIIADFITGVALLVIGICATQWNFMPVDLQYAFIGAGSAYSIGLWSVAGLIIKNNCTKKYLC